MVSLVGYGVCLSIDSRRDVVVDRVDEVVAMELGVKPQDAAAENPVDDRLAPRADPERLGVGPGNVPESDDGRFRQPLPDHARQQREVIVLDQDDGIGGLGFAHHPVGKPAGYGDGFGPDPGAAETARVGTIGPKSQAPGSPTASSN